MSKAYFWSLIITSHITSVCLWSRDEEETSVVSYGPEVSWNDEAELIEAVDTSLTEATASIPSDAGEPTKTVFGVPSGWVTEGHIKKDYLALIREICSKLSLSPVGFVVIPEAISHEVKQNEGGPLSAVVVGIAKTTLEVTLFRLGTLAGTVEVGRSVSLTEDLIEALTRFQSNDALPSRFVVYGASKEELGDISHLLSSVTWKDANDKLMFLHEPKIELATNERLLSAISLAGSSEMGPVKLFVTPQKTPEPLEENIVPTDVSLNDLGFAIDADITKINPKDHSQAVAREEEHATAIHATSSSKAFQAKHKMLAIIKKPSALIGALPFKKKSFDTLPIEQPHVVPHAKRRSTLSLKTAAIFGFLGFSIIFGGVVAAWYFLPQADITIFISPRSLTTHETFALKEGTDTVDIDNKVLPVAVFTKTVSGEDSAPASGNKTVGDKAKGTVTIRNGTANGVKLPAGALLVGANDLKFTLDESASVSAATSPASPGTITLSATAAAIGSDYNLAKDQTLKVGNFLTSEIDAVVAETFTGGSSRQITAVSKADLDSLEQATVSKLTAQAKEEIVREVPENYSFIPDSVTTKTNTKVFDHKAGDEASSVNLSLEIQATAYAIPKDAIKQAAEKLLTSQVPGGYSFRPEQVQTDFEIQKGQGGDISANIGLTAHLLPNVNPDDVARAVSGKRFATANNYLGTIPGFVRAAITINPALPDPIRFVPFVAQRIEVSIEAEK